MIPFKNLNPGFSFIEIMAALTLLGIFGPSLFLVQSNMFSKVSKTHQALFFSENIIYGIQQLKNKIHQAILEKKTVDTLSIQEDKKNPDHAINIKLLKISQESELKNFAKHVRMVESTATYDNGRTIHWFSFMYIPELLEKESGTKNSYAKAV